MVKGFLRSKGINAGAVRIGKCLSIISPAYLAARRSNAERNINPVPYKADYFGHKLHLDQNEKLSMYGLTHVCASDGYSGKIVAFATMPVKNNALIYEHVYRWVDCFCPSAHWGIKHFVSEGFAKLMLMFHQYLLWSQFSYTDS